MGIFRSKNQQTTSHEQRDTKWQDYILKKNIDYLKSSFSQSISQNQSQSQSKNQSQSPPQRKSQKESEKQKEQKQQNSDLRKYLKLISYPNTQLAQLHSQTNCPRKKNGKENPEKDQGSKPKKRIENSQQVTFENLKFCPCCGNIKQQQKLKICSSLVNQISCIGISTYFVFVTSNIIQIILLIATTIFGVYAILTNVTTMKSFKEQDRKNFDLDTYAIVISVGPKIYSYTRSQSNQYDKYLHFQAWLGLVFVVALIIFYFLMEKYEASQKNLIDNQIIKSAANYTIMIQGIPFYAEQNEIKQQIEQLYRFLSEQKRYNKYKKNKKQIKISKINKGTPRSILQKINKKVQKDLQLLSKLRQAQRQNYVSWIKQLLNINGIKTPRSIRQTTEKYVSTSLDQFQFYYTQKKKTYQDKLLQTDPSPTDVFVSFQNKSDVDDYLELIESSCGYKFLKYLTLSACTKSFKMKFKGKQYSVQIKKASMPEDIVWENIGIKTSSLIRKKILTFAVSGVLLAVLFVIVFVSSIFKQPGSGLLKSFGISALILFFNFLISLALKGFTYLEYNPTQTHFLTSFAFKTTIAKLINLILIPLLVNLYVGHQDQFFQKNGLSDDIFWLSLTTSFIKPIFRILRPELISRYFKIWYNSDAERRFQIRQKDLNKIYQLNQFQSGKQYVYMLSLYLFTCFYMSLQPIIIWFTGVGITLNYWILKYKLFNLSKKPVPGSKTQYDTLVQFIYAGGFLYSVGSLLFTNIIPEKIYRSNINGTLAPNILSIVISAISLFIPYSFIYDSFSKKQTQKKSSSVQQSSTFSEDCLQFQTQYDRLNPITCEKAKLQYKGFLEDRKKLLLDRISKYSNDEKSLSQSNKIQKKLARWQYSGSNIYSYKNANPWNSFRLTPHEKIDAFNVSFNNYQITLSIFRLSDNPSKNAIKGTESLTNEKKKGVLRFQKIQQNDSTIKLKKDHHKNLRRRRSKMYQKQDSSPEYYQYQSSNIISQQESSGQQNEISKFSFLSSAKKNSLQEDENIF